MPSHAQTDKAYIKTMMTDPDFTQICGGFLAYKGFNITNSARGAGNGAIKTNYWTVPDTDDRFVALTVEECVRRIDLGLPLHINILGQKESGFGGIILLTLAIAVAAFFIF